MNWKLYNIFSWLVLFLFSYWYIYLVSWGYLPAPELFVNNVVEKVPVEKKVEVVKVVKYIEKVGMKTSEFIVHLNPRIDPVIADQIGVAIDEYSKKYQLPRKLILSIIKKESFFNPLSKSSVGALGLMQVFPKYHKDKMKALGINDDRMMYHIDNNINIGCQIFNQYYEQSKGDLDETFHKYLSKNASKEQRDRYMDAILTTWARLEFMEYQYKNNGEKGNF